MRTIGSPRQAVLCQVPALLNVVRSAFLEQGQQNIAIRPALSPLARSASSSKFLEARGRREADPQRSHHPRSLGQSKVSNHSHTPRPSSSRKLIRLDDSNLRAPLKDQFISLKPRDQLPFNSYALHEGLQAAISARFGQHCRPTPIQSLSLQHFNLKLPETRSAAERNAPVLLAAETGSGKTLAYLLPLAQFLKSTDAGPPSALAVSQDLRPRSLVISPTHELTRQLTDSAKLLAHAAKLRVVGLSSLASGAVPRKGAVDICIGTGGSLARGLGVRRESVDVPSAAQRAATISASDVEKIVIDEADVLLGRNFVEDTKLIISHVSEARRSRGRPAPQIVLATATLPPSLIAWIDDHLPGADIIRSPALHRLPARLRAKFVPFSGSGNRLADVAHEVKRVLAQDARDRAVLEASTQIKDLWEQRKTKIIIFCNTEGKVRMLSKVLQDRALPCLSVTSNADQRTRGTNGLLEGFLLPVQGAKPATSAEGKEPRILVTTSLLSRGLDFAPDVRHVFLLDTPRDTLDFLHRAGRSGRAGKAGCVTIFGGRESLPPGIRQLLGQ